METTALKGRQGVQQEMDMLKMDWDNYTTQLKALRDGLDRAVQQWTKYEEQYDRIAHWVKDMEKKVKDCPLRSTMDEKQAQLQKFQVGRYGGISDEGGWLWGGGRIGLGISDVNNYFFLKINP